jgi:two-component system chemotaxis response regulator CheB
MRSAYRIVVVGTSWGGLAALRELVSCLPADLPLPVAIVQHRHKHSDQSLALFLQDRSHMPVCEVEDKAPIERGKVYVAPSDYHLLVEADSFALSVDDPIRYSRPSIDLLFASAADSFGAATIGIVLTGANADGSEGLKRIVERGGLALVQEPATAESPTMPAAALKAVPTAKVLTVAEIGAVVSRMGSSILRESSRSSTSGPEMRP